MKGNDYMNIAKALAQGLIASYIFPDSKTFQGIVSGVAASLLDDNPELDHLAFIDSVNTFAVHGRGS